MSSVRPRHGGYQGEIYFHLRSLLPRWLVIIECALRTSEGVKAPDVTAMPPERCPNWTELSHLPFAPDICVEVLSQDNTQEEMDEKRRLYAAQGCREFWTCSEHGEVSFVDASRGERRETSAICPEFPASISLD